MCSLPAAARRPLSSVVSAIVLCLLASLALAGCGGAGSDGDASEAAPSTTSTSSPTSSTSPTGPTGPTSSPAATGPLGAVLRARPPARGDDFPLLPAGCQSPTQPMPFRPCHVTDFGLDRPTVAVWGDSHAWMYLAALREAAVAKRVNLVMILAGGCPPALPAERVAGALYTECDAHDVAAAQYVRTLAARSQPFALVVGAFWSGYLTGSKNSYDHGAITAEAAAYNQHIDGLVRTRTQPLFAELGSLGVTVAVIGEAATVPPTAPSCPTGRDPYLCDLPRATAIPGESATRAWLGRVMRPLAGHPFFIDTTPAYCDASVCHAEVGGRHTWYDAIHLGMGLTRTMSGYFLPVFNAVTWRGARRG